MTRTTHSDLAGLLEILAEKLAAIPAGFLVGDASTRNLLTDTARILVEQDNKIDAMRVALRLAREALPAQERAEVNRALAL